MYIYIYIYLYVIYRDRLIYNFDINATKILARPKAGQNFNVKFRVCISLICRNSDIVTTSTFSYIRSLRRHISLLSRCIYTFRRMGLTVVSVVFPSKIRKCTE